VASVVVVWGVSVLVCKREIAFARRAERAEEVGEKLREEEGARKSESEIETERRTWRRRVRQIFGH